MRGRGRLGGRGYIGVEPDQMSAEEHLGRLWQEILSKSFSWNGIRVAILASSSKTYKTFSGA